MEIKTITCHDVYNVGASLQAFALSKYLMDLGHDVEVVDYKPDYLSKQYSLLYVANPKYERPVLRELYLLLKLPERVKSRFSKRKKEYDCFTAQFLPTTKRKYISNNDLKQNLPEADIYFAGSDQIWNTLFRNGRDPAFYLDFASEKSIKASYAASFATDDIVDGWKDSVQQWIDNLDFVSVREQSGVELVKRLGINNVEQVLDPVFLLDANEWENLEESVSTGESYVLVYDFDGNKKIETFVENLARANTWKIYSILSCDYADICYEQYGPRTFINLIHNAQFVVSNSFHATAFSLIFQKQFVVFEREEKINSRMKDLVEMFGLENRMILGENCDIVSEQINYEFVLKTMNCNIKKSKDYIERVIRRAMENEKKDTVCY